MRDAGVMRPISTATAHRTNGQAQQISLPAEPNAARGRGQVCSSISSARAPGSTLDLVSVLGRDHTDSLLLMVACPRWENGMKQERKTERIQMVLRATQKELLLDAANLRGMSASRRVLSCTLD